MLFHPPVFRSIDALRALVGTWRAAGFTVGMVPTMGALHAGHVSLVRAAKARQDRVIATIFVNPTQFAPNEDFAAYPRTEDSDLDQLAAVGTDAVFAPLPDEMYPAGHVTAVSVEGGPALGLESDFRPHFFRGVATVVSKLLLAGMPDAAFFGEKDYQQLLVIRRMVADLRLPTDIVGLPTVREGDGLALSSRNAYLSAEERAIAPKLHAALAEAAEEIEVGLEVAEVLAAARQTLEKAGFRPDYVALRNAETLAEVADAAAEPLRLLAAAWLGRTRLIDNVAVPSPGTAGAAAAAAEPEIAPAEAEAAPFDTPPADPTEPAAAEAGGSEQADGGELGA
ncbi:pantoate--beta-alanine ligase [Prosthecomicrobium pneumaticum]|uniref:Pantothenate synthetase n=1 Tax=Prosthecomicrobium pneumaticum TaxID=81895 RepID=A0A7W9FNX6_9HYPH|nr:pantoate--beta-alanine ligase [Prosthecomicrobium pneumaticum]